MSESTRMQDAIILADKCWHKANRAAPEFVIEYLNFAEGLLIARPIVMGDEFRSHCAKGGLFLPNKLHHNTWVSGVRALYTMGWIEPVGKVEPEQSHNHMPEVTLWRSQIYGDIPTPFVPKQMSLI
jgi:hypothetical protein